MAAGKGYARTHLYAGFTLGPSLGERHHRFGAEKGEEHQSNHRTVG